MTSLAWPTIAEIEALGALATTVAPPDAEDENAHVNVGWFYTAHMHATDAGFAQTGFDEGYRQRTGHSFFSIEHHLRYYSEVLVGHSLSFYLRALGRTDKIIHGMTILVNNTTGTIANTVEFVDAHVDLNTRRSHPMGRGMAAQIDGIIKEHAALSWDLPRSKEMGPRRNIAT